MKRLLEKNRKVVLGLMMLLSILLPIQVVKADSWDGYYQLLSFLFALPFILLLCLCGGLLWLIFKPKKLENKKEPVDQTKSCLIWILLAIFFFIFLACVYSAIFQHL